MLEEFLTACFCYKVHFSGCELIWGYRKDSVEQGVVMGKGLQKCGKTTFRIRTAGVESVCAGVVFANLPPALSPRRQGMLMAQKGKKRQFLVAVFDRLFQLLACRQV